MLEFAILGLLKERPMHGYDLRKRLRGDFGLLANLSFGSLYPALARLKAEGAIHEVASPPAEGALLAVPFTGSLAGERAATVARRATAKAAAALGGRGTRARKVFEITERGEQLFGQLLESGDGRAGDTRNFSLRLAFARHLSPQARIRLLERQRLELTERLEQTTTSISRPVRELDAYEASLAEHTRQAVANDLAWVEGLLESERRAAEGTGAHPAGSTPASRSHAGRKRPTRSDVPITTGSRSS